MNDTEPAIFTMPNSVKNIQWPGGLNHVIDNRFNRLVAGSRDQAVPSHVRQTLQRANFMKGRICNLLLP